MQRRNRQKEDKMLKNSDIGYPIVKSGNLMFDILPPSLKRKTALSVLPIFGGTSPETKVEETTETKSETKPETKTETKPETKSETKTETETDTTQTVADLLKQVGELTKKVGTLSEENKGFKDKEEKATRASQTREQNLEKDLTDAQQTIEQMDAVIKHLALVNGIQGFKDAEWHSSRQVFAELKDDEYEIDIDLEKGTATVTGIENALKRVAKDCPWLVSKDKTQNSNENQNSTTSRRPSGGPPANPGTGTDPASKRQNMIGRFSALAGRTPTPPTR